MVNVVMQSVMAPSITSDVIYLGLVPYYKSNDNVLD